ncbi:5,10-methylenetetrahydrofolate reductase (NAD(P)) [Aliiroseovarius halocynthiae]|uniref:Methylenetetrahydrofolate reductase n=1 Tax=Aliiroseovarius halocynthiae TaxID=985055 RepID=A0A545SMP3_9RHOB|nr:methylenetetrahydrofolate reductase [NAD(P)H] [Aliiroseovarius halocynthiae]TQV66280.1 methylenetetrahydrofolate reductase [NAD(P)H] [Aliiroseovarius halocynthiae]SMR82628.1 5,10-methylenetetrahydrofolate reductase (NAD(P)) [Aliiroseovarius halocynthiae]
MITPNISFEFFPPQSLDASFRLWETVRQLAPLNPNFVSVTYGAGGTTRELTHDAVGTIHKHYGLNVAAHLTCVEASRDETLAIAKSYADVGVKEIVALRGDAPKGADRFTAREDGFADSVELIEALAGTGDFHIRVGAYPDPHPEAADLDADVAWLKRKVDAGANSAITQFFFEADTFFRFRDRCEKAGIDVPIIPGILPIENWKGVRKFAERCGATVPAWLDDAFRKAERDDRTDLLATAICTELCSDLIDGGVEDLHFYTLNKPGLTRDVAHALGVTPQINLANVA